MEQAKIVAVYNADEKKLVGLFTVRLAAFYIYGKYSKGMQRAASNINKAATLKQTIIKNELGFRVACRVATTAQVAMLDGREYSILDETTAHRITPDMLIGFYSTRVSLALNSPDPPGRTPGTERYFAALRENMRDRKIYANIIQ